VRSINTITVGNIFPYGEYIITLPEYKFMSRYKSTQLITTVYAIAYICISL